uniref:Uncharacterized protein n=1 Tax=Glossina palpalis gambiensis TaxID=67801 RepID=A0A1B0C219_9MUSC
MRYPCHQIKRLPLSLGSNSASNSALVGSCASAAAARAALADLFTALVLALLVLLLLFTVHKCLPFTLTTAFKREVDKIIYPECPT